MSGGRRSVSHGVQGVFVFVLLGAFAVMSTLMVLLGAQMYHGTIERTGSTNDERVLSADVRSMVRAYDRAGAVSIEQHGDITAIAMREAYDGERYVMRLYQYGDSLYEQYTEDGYAFDPAMGDAVCGIGRFEPALDGGVLAVDMTDDAGRPCSVYVALRAGAQGAVRSMR